MADSKTEVQNPRQGIHSTFSVDRPQLATPVHFYFYLLYFVPAFVGFGVSWLLAFRRLPLLGSDWLTLFLPGAIWLLLLSVCGEGKSLSNLVEGIYLGWSVALLSAIRTAVSLHLPSQQALVSLWVLVAACAASLAVWALVPGLAE